MFVLDGMVEPTVKRPLLPCNYFNMMAGSSTGGIIAIMLGVLKMDIDTCIAKYVDMAPKIFPQEGRISGSKIGKAWKGVKGTARFDGEGLEKFMKKLVKENLDGGDEDTLLETETEAPPASPCKVFVCVTNKDTGKPFRLRNHRSSRDPGTGCTIWQAARATSAAPLFFPPIRFGVPPANYVDGALRHNNPVRVLYEEAQAVFDIHATGTIRCIISIGTGVPNQTGTGDRGHEILKCLTAMALDSQQTAEDFGHEMKHLSTTANLAYVRLNVGQGIQDIEIEEWAHLDRLTAATNHYLNSNEELINLCAGTLLGAAENGSGSERCIVLSELPIPSQRFFGRRSEMEQIRAYLKPTDLQRKALVLWGLGGFGKSRLALEYIDLFKHEYTTILWINAVSLDTAMGSYLEAEREIIRTCATGSRPPGSENADGLSHVKRWLAQEDNDNWLMVIDSVDDLNSFDCRKLVPACSQGTVIVTSTNSRTASALGFKGLEIDSMDVAAGSEMLISRSEIEDPSDVVVTEATNIVKALDAVPLAIEQAAALLRDVIPFHEFFGLYKTQYERLMTHTPDKSLWYYDKNRSILTTYEMLYGTFKHKNPDAADILNLLPFFGPRDVPAQLLGPSPISSDLVSPRVSSSELSSTTESSGNMWGKSQWLDHLVQDQLSLRLALSRMEELCLLKTRRDSSRTMISFSMHNSICRWRVETLGQDTREEWAVLASFVLCRNLLEPDIPFERKMSYKVLVDHSRFMLRQHVAPASTEVPDGRLCRHYGFVMARFATLYLELGRVAEAEGILKAAIDYGRVTQGTSWPANVESLKLVKGQAELYSKTGQREKATEALEDLLRSSTNLLGDMDQITIWAAGKLRDIRETKVSYANQAYRALVASAGSKSRAIPDIEQGSNRIRYPAPEHVADMPDEEYTLVQVLQQTTEEFGEGDEDTLEAVWRLAGYYRSQHKFLEAEKHYERLWEEHQVRRINVPKSETLQYLLECYRATGHMKDALKTTLNTAIIWATRLGLNSLLKLLNAQGANFGAQGEGLSETLFWAIGRRNVHLVKLLLTAGADPKVTTRYGESPLLSAARVGYATIVEILLAHGVDTEASHTRSGLTPLIAAASNGNTAVVRLLLNGQTNVNARNIDGRTPLFGAVIGRYKAVVRLLLDAKANVDISAKNGDSPLHEAAGMGDKAIVRLLLEAKANINAGNIYGRTPLFEAVIGKYQAVVLLLLDAKANVNISAKNDDSLLHEAAHMGNEAIVRLLLKAKANVNISGQYGDSPLHTAVKNNQEILIRSLLRYGADRQLKNASGETPLDLAISFKHEAEAVADVLRAQGTNAIPHQHDVAELP